MEQDVRRNAPVDPARRPSTGEFITALAHLCRAEAARAKGRKPSGTGRGNSGRASSKRTPWWASDTSPGVGTCLPPISPASDNVWCCATQALGHTAGASATTCYPPAAQ